MQSDCISEDNPFKETIICENDILIKDDVLPKTDNSDNDTSFELLRNNNSKIRIVSLPPIQDLDTKASWSKNMTKALLEEYTIMLDHFRTPDRKQKELWIELSARMRGKGFNVHWEMCNRKFRNLKQTYRSIHYSNRPERSKRRWEFYDDLNVLISTPPNVERNKSVSPPLSPVPQDNDTNVEATSILNMNESNVTTTEIPAETSNIIQHSQSTSTSTESEKDPPLWFKEFLIQFKIGQENMLENIKKMHNESKELELRKIKLLENVLSLMNQNKY